MNFDVEFVCLCNTGKVRKENQDNFWCMGKYLESNNNGLLLTETGVVPAAESPAFAVFDGVGGEQFGEMAAYIAADEFNRMFMESDKKNTERFLDSSCRAMNDRICRFADENGVFSMGTTAAIIMFEKTSAYICNLGDSRVYKFSKSSLVRLSQDHVATSLYGGRKPALAQYLGIPEEEFVINPYIVEEKCISGDRFLICSDGLTDMLSEVEIQQVIAENEDLSSCAFNLLNTALENGGIDNTTIILCDFLKRR